jgi:hypothetical protein
MEWTKSDIGKILALVLVVIFLRIGYFVEPVNVDQGVMLTIGKDIAQGKKLYTETWTHHLPIPHYIFATAFYFDLDPFLFLNLLEIINISLAGILLYFLVALVFDKQLAFFAFFVYALLFNNVLLGGWYSRCEPEIFFEIPWLLLLLLSYARHASIKPGYWAFLQGILWAILLFIKISSAVFIGCILADYFWNQKQRSLSFFFAFAYFFIGFAFVAVAFVLWFLFQGNLSEFWEYVFVYHYYYRSQESLINLWYAFRFSSYLAPAFLLALYGYLHYCFQKQKNFAIVFWPIASLAQVIIQGKYWWYHFIPCLTPLCIFLAVGLCRLFLKKWKNGLVWGIVFLLLLLAPFFQVCFRYYRDHKIFSYLQGTVPRQEFLATYFWPDHNFNASTIEQAGRYVRSLAKKGDHLFVFGYASSLYVYADLPCSSRYIFFSNNMFPSEYYFHLMFTNLENEFKATPPEFIIVCKDGPAKQKNFFVEKFFHRIQSSYKKIAYFPELEIWKKNSK